MLQVSASVFEEKEGGGGLEERIAMMERKIDRLVLMIVMFAMMMQARFVMYAQAAGVDIWRPGSEEAGPGRQTAGVAGGARDDVSAAAAAAAYVWCQLWHITR